MGQLDILDSRRGPGVAEIVIPVEILLGAMIAILSALFAISFKNTRCIARMEGKLDGVVVYVAEHKKEAADAQNRLRTVETDIAILKGSGTN